MEKHFYHKLQLHKPSKRPLIACNMVTSLDGKVTADGNQPAKLGSAFDFKTMGVIRSHFDAVLAGGNTIRTHPFYLGVPKKLAKTRLERGLQEQPLTVLLTRSGNLDPASPLFSNAPRPPIIITTEQGAQKLPTLVHKKAQIETLSEPSPEAITTLLQDKYQVNYLLLEGGPSVNYQFMEAKMLNELFLTLHPSLIGKKTDLGLSAGERVLDQAKSIRIISVHQENNELFLRYQINW